jgi:hypothetical protein
MSDELHSKTFTCPICLGEQQIISCADADEESNTPHYAVTQDGNPIFELTSCNHKYCAACLRAYVRSKLLDGEVDIACCHFKISMLEEDFQPCNVLITESDIYNLAQMDQNDDDDCSEQCTPVNDDFCCIAGEPYEFGISRDCGCSSKDCSKKGEGEENNQLWTKYQKLKFDAHHGKDAVRRCPKCDEAQLFDVECMKQYQANHLANNIAPSVTDGINPSSSNNMSRLERVISMFRQRQSEAVSFTTAAANESDSSERAGSNIPAQPKEEGDIQMKDLTKVDDTALGDVNLTEASNCGEGDDNKSLDEGDNDTSPDNKTPETGAPQSLDAAKQSEYLAKSTTPTVTCHKCDTKFCYFHSNAHPGKSCIEYHKQNLEMDRTNIDYANRILHAKPCPTCGISVSKEGGCNQMKCGNCGTHFCWLCGTIVDDGAFPEHFRWWNLRGCANMQLDENNEPLRCTVWGAKLLSALQILVLGIPSLALTIVSMLLCPCLVPGCGRTNRERVVNCISFWGSFLSSMLLLPFTCVGMMLLSALYCFLAFIAMIVKVLKSKAGLTRTSTNSGSNNARSLARRDFDPGVDAGDSSNAATNDDFIRELENIFERMEAIEEGLSPSNSHDGL